jgi:hypothetical protein
MYERPSLQRLGSLRDLTQYGTGNQNDLLGIWLNAITPSAPDGCTQGGGLFTGCRGSN